MRESFPSTRARHAKARSSLRHRLTTVVGAAGLLTGLFVVIPVLSLADPPQAVTPNVQNIDLGEADAPAPDVDVVDPADSDAPAPSSEQSSAPDPTGGNGSGESEAPDTEAPQSSAEPSAPTTADPSAPSTPDDDADDQEDQGNGQGQGQGNGGNNGKNGNGNGKMNLPPGSKVLKLNKNDVAGFASVGVSWVGDAPIDSVAVQIQVKGLTGGWSEWTDLSVNRDVVVGDEEDVAARNGTDPYWFGDSKGIRVAVTTVPGTEISDIKLTLIDPREVAQDANPDAAAPTSSAGAALNMPAVYSRAQWGADESLASWGPKYMPSIKAATVHHTADGNNYSQADVPGIMRSIYYYQAETLGWGDIGYNVVVDKFGRAWEGRKGGLDQPVIGAHAGGFNRSTFGVSMLGNYDTVNVTPAMMEKVAQLIAWKFKIYGLNPTGSVQLTQYGGSGTTAKFKDGQTVTLPSIFGHREVGSTACPGRYGYAALPALRTRVAQIMSTLDPPPAYSPEGALNVTAGSSGSLSIDGWLIDRSTIAAPVDGAVTVDGKVISYFTANGRRPELSSMYGIPGDHGFAMSTTVSSGTHTVCLFATNVGGGSNNMPACKTVGINVKPVAPVGAMNVATVNGGVRVDGWVYDGSAPLSPVPTRILVDGAVAQEFSASGPRPELTNYGIFGNHGYVANVVVPKDGSHKICMNVQDLGTNNWVQISCKTVTVSGNNPVGAMAVSRASGRVNINGWAFDASDLNANVTVMFTQNGKAVSFALANGPRPELNAMYGMPGNHGFVTSFAATSGTNTICMFVFNIGNGQDSIVQCKNV